MAIVFVDNPIYRRMLSLYDAATNASHKQEVISGGLQHYISLGTCLHPSLAFFVLNGAID